MQERHARDHRGPVGGIGGGPEPRWCVTVFPTTRAAIHRLILAGLLALGAALACATAVAQPIAPGFVGVEGKRFVDDQGKTVHLKGINLGNWLMQEGYIFKFKKAGSPKKIHAAFEAMAGVEGARAFWKSFHDVYVTEDDIRFIAAAGFNLIRIPLHYGLFVKDGDPPRFEGEGYALLDRVIGWAKNAGLRVVMDMHAAPGGQTGINHDDGPGYPLMFYVPRHRALTVALWKHIAARYRDEPAVLGYDLLNEPIAPYHDTAYLIPRLEPFYRETTAAIRSVNPRHVVFLAGPRWSTNFDGLGPPFANGLAYTFHSFWSSTRRDAIQKLLDFRDRHDVPLFLGESGELTDEWNAAFRALQERHGIGWSFWTYKNLDSTSTVYSIPRPTDWDAIVAFVDRHAAGDRTATPPPRDVVERALADYRRGARFGGGVVRASYLESLGLKAPK